MARAGVYELRDPEIPNNVNFADENSDLRPKNTYFWKIFDWILGT